MTENSLFSFVKGLGVQGSSGGLEGAEGRS